MAADTETRTEVVPLRTPAAVTLLAALCGIAFFAGSCHYGLSAPSTPLKEAIGALWIPFIGMTLTFLLLDRLVGASSLTLGDDGLLLRRGLRQRFLPFDRLRAVRVVITSGEQTSTPFAELELQLDGGQAQRLRPEPHLHGVQRLAARIERRRDRHKAGPTLLFSPLARGNRDVGAWRTALETARDDFRVPMLSPAQLDEALASPLLPIDQRVGAALLLRRIAASDGDGEMDEVLPRIRVAAETTANPEARAALEAVATAELDQDALERALRRLPGS